MSYQPPYQPSHWDARFLDMARLVASWSKDPSTQVGAVIVDPCNRVVSTGFNGFPRGIADEYTTREAKLLRTLHAEVNAILFAGRDLTGCRIYVTHTPCARCAVQIIQSGISCVLSAAPTIEFATRWQNEVAESIELMCEAGIEYVEIQS